MDRGESNEEKKRKHSDDDASTSQRSVRAKTSSSMEEKHNIISEPASPPLELGLLPSALVFDLNSPPPQEPPSDFVIPYPPPLTQQLVDPPAAAPSKSRPRRNPSQGPSAGKSETVPPPFPWATDRRATVHSLRYLNNNSIETITGDVQCKKCERKWTLDFNVDEKFYEVLAFIMEKKDEMHDRAPDIWMNPTLLNCNHCGQENCVRPIIIPKNKKGMNWLFLLLGQWLGLCSLGDLKYFCKHTRNHRTGAKDRVLYLTYIALCKQIYPDAPLHP
ncbi:hypothetical protein Lalb_Chr08g0246571 [Lupinus albus]|uniref:DUF7086 domain-containing protein n=1 Tax=Lupinus albus TaxID=3870 RepID=A0A6A4MIA2_LUPAL|nr:hypothetical protein Lalb_Chr00c44g0412581 [Lupinus albus]KAE9609478.1 hypothetical protein Lalb_Chr08g0246571 [Lupinus albus]